MFSRDLVMGLNVQGQRPWAEQRKGKPITEMWLAQQLRPYGITPRTMRIGGEVAKGYALEDFKDTLRRYVPNSELESFKADLSQRVVRKEKKEPASPNTNGSTGMGEGD